MAATNAPPRDAFVLATTGPPVWRDNSPDSRFADQFGDAGLADLVATGGTIFWSRDPACLFTPVR